MADDRLYEFDGFVVDPIRSVLLGPQGERIPLKPKVFDTLLFFVERRGELLDKQTLMRAVWHDAIVEENSLNQHISILRQVFGERRGDNRFIVTVPRRGYRFVAEVLERRDDQPPGTAWAKLADGFRHEPSGATEIVMSRGFDAPRERVFDAWTKPELLRRWYKPLGWSMTVCEIDLRPGGAWHFVTRSPEGIEVSQRGEYVEVERPKHIRHLERWDGIDVGEMDVDMVFAAQQDHTRLTSRIRFRGQRDRDRVIDMRVGGDIREVLGQLVELLAGETGV